MRFLEWHDNKIHMLYVLYENTLCMYTHTHTHTHTVYLQIVRIVSGQNFYGLADSSVIICLEADTLCVYVCVYVCMSAYVCVCDYAVYSNVCVS